MPKTLFYHFLLATLGAASIASCSARPSPKEIQTAIAETQAAIPSASATPTDTPTPRPTNTLPPSRTPSPSSTPSSTPTPDPVFVSPDAFCEHISGLSDIQQAAFDQKQKGHLVGPWEGRVRYYFPGDSVYFYVDAPDFNDSPRFEVNLSFPVFDYTIDEVYEFYGSYMFSVGDGKYHCVAMLLADDREGRNRPIDR